MKEEDTLQRKTLEKKRGNSIVLMISSKVQTTQTQSCLYFRKNDCQQGTYMKHKWNGEI